MTYKGYEYTPNDYENNNGCLPIAILIIFFIMYLMSSCTLPKEIVEYNLKSKKETISKKSK